MNPNFNPYKDFIIAVGMNESGKTTLVQQYLLAKISKEKLYVINSSNEPSWSKFALPDHIFKPVLFKLEWLEKTLLRIVAKSKGQALIVLDDQDNFPIKMSDIIKSIVINARHLDLGLIMTTRNLQSIPKILYAQAKYIYVASQESDYDCFYLATVIGYERCRLLKGLPEHTFAVWGRKERSLEFIKYKM